MTTTSPRVLSGLSPLADRTATTVTGHRVVLVTFAGRRDRMELLTRYVTEAMRRKLIDEWHVWNFSRNEADDRWLREQFPAIGRSPDNQVYFPAGRVTVAGNARWRCRVRAGHDVHIAFGPHRGDGDAPAYEFVIGGWSNQRTVLRHIDNRDLLIQDHDDRAIQRPPIAVAATPGIMSGNAFRDIELSIDPTGVGLSVDGAEIIRSRTPVPAGMYDVQVKTGYGSDGEWRFPGVTEYLYNTDGPGWGQVYDLYSAHAQYYADSVFLKCDDDIVYLQLDKLADFLRFRIDQQRYFLVTANVVNNNVCAYYQQQSGAIPASLMTLELPPGGFRGSLWESPELATRLHNHFLDNPDAFEQNSTAPIFWSERLSINFVAWLGRDLSYMSAISGDGDDERILSVDIPSYLKRPNCIYPGFVASHLSYFSQEAAMDTAALMSRYRRLAAERGLPLPERSMEMYGR
ncbi:hypothetical protein NONI108955_14350 [Nocardia ninae]|uniref:Farnesoic acid O-methyl transferase domain-containing protein n=1 Tax=Nocardia ninae NBRC 108245 TaxID=1210091 RepID=A0A511M4F1_9NOCA|nr:hypothetical protein [Nocardia ninae]GEM35523.1 hypothetical protein NN4_00420 [Nocardia ninae NBRC 108245]